MSALDFSLTLFVHETQMQHGLRAENHDRYHCYLSNRVAKLREQLKLSNDKKKFLNKDITPAIAKSPKHLMLLALYAERCWTAAECLQETRRAVARASHSEGTQPPGGCPPSDQFRKRLNKAVKWAEKLKTVAAAVGSERVQAECCGYFLEVSGRASLSHGLYEDAREKFYAAREKYYQLLATSADEERGVVVRKVNELDDRVTYCMQRLGQDPTTYSPPVAASGQEGSTTIQWNGRQLSVTSMKVKDALREAREVPVESVQQRVLSTPGPVAVGHTTKVLDLLDRRINYYNDALAHARQDLRTAVEGAHKTELQLLEHFFHYQVSHETLRRTLFMTEVYARRFHATEGALLRASSAKGRSRKGAIVEGQYASPAEVVRLFEVGLEAIDAMELLPGVSGREEVMHYTALCQAGRLIYTGESWRVSGNTAAERSAATRCYNTAVALLQPFNTPRATELREYAERRSLQLAAESVGQTSSSTASATVPFLSEALKAKTGVVAVAEAVVRFPPDFQAAPCKPVFVDVAATYVDFGHLTESSSAPAAATSATAAAADGAKSEKKWGWGWRS